MKFQFKIQQYQTDAVESVVNIFAGQPYSDRVSYVRDLGVNKKTSILKCLGLTNLSLRIMI